MQDLEERAQHLEMLAEMLRKRPEQLGFKLRDGKRSNITASKHGNNHDDRSERSLDNTLHSPDHHNDQARSGAKLRGAKDENREPGNHKEKYWDGDNRERDTRRGISRDVQHGYARNDAYEDEGVGVGRLAEDQRVSDDVYDDRGRPRAAARCVCMHMFVCVYMYIEREHHIYTPSRGSACV